jgi:hypothetical protein
VVEQQAYTLCWPQIRARSRARIPPPAPKFYSTNNTLEVYKMDSKIQRAKRALAIVYGKDLEYLEDEDWASRDFENETASMNDILEREDDRNVGRFLVIYAGENYRDHWFCSSMKDVLEGFIDASESHTGLDGLYYVESVHDLDDDEKWWDRFGLKEVFKKLFENLVVEINNLDIE